MPVEESQLIEALNLEIENGNFIVNCHSNAFNNQFLTYELQPGQNTAIRTIEDVEKIFQGVSIGLLRVVEIYQENDEKVRLQLKLKVSCTLPGNVEESSTVLSEPMWGTAACVENGVHKMLVELKSQRGPPNGIRFTYFPLQVQIMKLPQTISLENMTPSGREVEGLINIPRRARTVLTFQNVGNKYPLDYVMFCSFDYRKVSYCRGEESTPEWSLYSNPSIAFLIDGPKDGMGVNTGGVHWLQSNDVTREFIVKMNRFGAAIDKNLDTHKDKYDTRKAAKHKNDSHCCICGKPITSRQKTDIHHCHRTGAIFGRAHHNCNANWARKQDFLPVFVHCQNADDFRGILMSLFRDRGLKTISKKVKHRERDEQIRLVLPDLPLVFINAHRFLPDSLENLKAFFPRNRFNRSNNLISYFRTTPVPQAVKTTLLLADTVSLLRQRIDEKLKLDFCRYHSLNEFVLDSILKKADVDWILPCQSKGIIRPFPETLKDRLFKLSEFNGMSPILRALQSYLPSSDLRSVPPTEYSRFSSRYIAKLLNKAPVGYFFQITVDGENGDAYLVHYILLKYLIQNRKLQYSILEIIQFNQTPFMDVFVSEFLSRSQLDRKLGQFFCEHIIENTNMVKSRRDTLKSVSVVEAADFCELVQLENFKAANCFAENLVEVLKTENYNWYEFTYLSLALRDIIFAFTFSSQN